MELSRRGTTSGQRAFGPRKSLRLSLPELLPPSFASIVSPVSTATRAPIPYALEATIISQPRDDDIVDARAVLVQHALQVGVVAGVAGRMSNAGRVVGGNEVECFYLCLVFLYDDIPLSKWPKRTSVLIAISWGS